MKQILITMGMVLTSCAAMAATQVVDGITWTYTVSGGKAIVTKASPATGAVTIPSTLGGRSVTSIDASAFLQCTGLTSVTIPSSVTSIGSYAFSGCSGLTSVTIPSSVTSIGRSAFNSCSGLKSVTIPLSVTSIGDSVFSGCSGLTSVTIPSSVASICDYAFSRCTGLTSVTIPASVTSIGQYAFGWCGGLMSFDVDAGNPSYKSVNGLLLSKDDMTLISGINGNVVVPDGVTSIGERAFINCSGLTSVTIPSSVTSIGDSAFACCSGLTSVTIPEGVTSIGDDAFDWCSGLKSVTIPSSVTSIGYGVFKGCSGLTSVPIPASVTSIGEYAFGWCSVLTNVVFGGNAPTCGSHAFYSVKGGCTATVKWGTSGWGSSGKWLGLTLKYVDKPITFTAIGYEGVYDGLGHGITVTVTDPAEGAVVTYARTEDGDYAETPILFTNVTAGAQSVYYKITAEGYAPTNGVATVTITPKPDGGPYTESVGETEWTFEVSGGKAIVTKASPATGAVTIPSTLGGRSVTSIDASAFLQCTGLTSVTIPASVTKIGNSAFWGCTQLADVYFEGDTISSIEHEAFTDCYWDLIMHVPTTWKGRGRTICGYTVLKGSMFIVK